MRLLTFFLALFFFSTCFSQTKISGIISDSLTGKPLAFVNIVAAHTQNGTATDIDGKFSLQAKGNIEKIQLSYVGYYPKTIAIYSSYLEIKMVEKQVSLKEVVILPGNNPAHRIIKKAVANKALHNPEKMKEYLCNSYNKIIYTANRDKFLEEARSDAQEGKKPDSSAIKMADFLKTKHLLLIESYTEKKKLAPDKEKETILSSRVSGLKAPSFTALATDVQPFSFYEDYITLLDKKYLNPISSDSWNKYLFVLEDTAFSEKDTTFIISFTQKKGRNFDALKGVVYINTNGYAIQNVIAEPFHESLNKAKVQQKYTLVNGEQWFPAQLNFNWEVAEYGMQIIGRSYISNIDLNPKLTNKDFDEMNIEMADGATDSAIVFFNKNRPDPLTKIEQNTYHYMDSIGEEKNLDKKMKTLEPLAGGNIPLSIFDLKISSIYTYNDFEGNRFGLRTETNEKLLKWVELGGYFAYGVKDKLWKYGGDVKLKLHKRTDINITGSYTHDVEEPGNIDFLESKVSGSNAGLKSFLASRTNLDEKYAAAYSMRLFRYFLLETGFSKMEKTILSDYQYTIANNENVEVGLSKMTFTEATVKVKFAYQERFAEVFGKKVSLGTDYPIIWFNYEKGLQGVLNGFFDYQRISMKMSETFRLKRLGEITLQAEAGKLIGDAPVSHNFYGKASFSNSLFLQVDNTFQTMRLYEFLSDRFVQFFYSHNLGKIHFKTEKFKPEFILVQNVGFGDIAKPENHQFITFKSMEKGYHESGLLIKNIVRFNYLDLAWLGIGAGAYYRYGPYSLNTPLENLAAKLSLSFSL